MDSVESLNLDEILQHTASLLVAGRVNFYSIKYFLKKKDENFAICLPDNMNNAFIRDICKHLEDMCHRRCVPFNPVSYEAETYEYLSIDQIRNHWDVILELVKAAKDFKDKENKKKVSEANLSVCELRYQNNCYYLCSKQQTLTGMLKGKKVLMSGNDKLEAVDPGKLFLLNNCVDFIICAPGSAKEGWVFIFHRENFISIFKYHEYLKRTVMEKLSEVDQWEFLQSAELIKNKSNQKNIYLNLTKVFSDRDYLRQMKQVRPQELKRRLLDKSGGAFTESDFDGEKIAVTTKNLDKVMKMLAKGFRYNFFMDRAEEV